MECTRNNGSGSLVCKDCVKLESARKELANAEAEVRAKTATLKAMMEEVAKDRCSL
jgi:hypothetical protein